MAVLVLFILPILLFAEPGSILIGERLLLDGQLYEVEAELGKGGFGKAYKLQSHNRPGHFLAMKTLSFQQSGGVIGNLNFRTGALQAARTASEIPLRFAPKIHRINLNPTRNQSLMEPAVLYAHPNTDVAIISPLATSDLETLFKKNENLRDRVALVGRVLDDLLPEIALLAHRGLVHGDIKPPNILLGSDGRFGLHDFDTLVSVREPSRVFTYAYVAPEVLENRKILMNPNFDIYSLAVTIAYGILGERALEWDAASKRFSAITALSEIKAEISRSNSDLIPLLDKIIEFLDAGLSENPEMRHEKFLKTSFSSHFKKENGDWTHAAFSASHLSPELQKLQLILSEHIQNTENLVNKLKELSEVEKLLRLAFSEKSLFLPAYRAALALGIPVNEMNRKLAKLIRQNGLSHPNQFQMLAYILRYDVANTEDVAEAILKRYVLPFHAKGMLNPVIYERMSKHPRLMKKYGSIFHAHIRREVSENDSPMRAVSRWSLLFLESELVPEEIVSIWRKIMENLHFTDLELMTKVQAAIERQDKLLAHGSWKLIRQKSLNEATRPEASEGSSQENNAETLKSFVNKIPFSERFTEDTLKIILRRYSKFSDLKVLIQWLRSHPNQNLVSGTLSSFRNSLSVSDQLVAAAISIELGEINEQNKKTILRHGLDIYPGHWLTKFYPLNKVSDADINDVIHFLKHYSGPDPTMAISILSYLGETRILESAQFPSLINATNPKIKQSAIGYFLNLNPVPPGILSKALEEIISKRWPLADAMIVFQDKRFVMQNSHFEMLVSDFLNAKSPTRFFSKILLRNNSPLPTEFANRIETTYPSRHYLETLGSRLKQPSRANQCTLFYGSSI